MIKTAIVTGAASGLGYELALLLAKDSYNLILIDIDTINLDVAKQSILESYSVDVKLIVKDLSEENVAEVIFADTDWKRELEMLQVHIITTTHLTKLVLDGMIKQKSGKILNMSSLAAFQPGPLMSIYYASKGYMLSFSEAIANELKGTGVTVTALCPGPTKTSFQDVVSNGTTDNKITFNMACPQKVAAYGYKAMHQGKTVAIPGVFNKFLSGLPRFLSRNRATSIVRQIQERNREV